MTNRNKLFLVPALVGLIGLAPVAGSAQTVSELGDAADLPAGAQLETGKQITLLTGSLGTTSDIDMYRITIDDPTNFSATSSGPSGPTYTSDTRLFLFDATGRAVYFNDDLPDESSLLSVLPAGHALSPTVPGDYLLAVTTYPRYPTDGSTNIFLEPDFDPVAYTDIVGPNPATSNPVTAWAGGTGPDGDYEITITGVDGTLPVVMSLPTAVVDGNSVQIEWRTEDEDGSLGFEVEYRKPLDADFQVGGYAQAVGSPSTYRQSVSNLSPGRYLFRVKSIGNDGGSYFSALVEAQVGLDGQRLSVETYPNPFTAMATVELVSPDDQHVEIAVYDLIGRRVATLGNVALASGERAQVELDGSTMTAGTYVIRLSSGSTVETRMITLNR